MGFVNHLIRSRDLDLYIDEEINEMLKELIMTLNLLGNEYQESIAKEDRNGVFIRTTYCLNIMSDFIKIPIHQFKFLFFSNTHGHCKFINFTILTRRQGGNFEEVSCTNKEHEILTEAYQYFAKIK